MNYTNIRLTEESAAEHLDLLYRLGGLAKTIHGDYFVGLNNGWAAIAPEDAARDLAEKLSDVDMIRKRICELGADRFELPLPVIKVGDFQLHFHEETEHGEPQAWLTLKDGSSIEVTHEEYTFKPEDRYFSLRHHCPDEDFENGAYHDTMGVIEQCSGGLADIAPVLQRIVTERGISSAMKVPEPVLKDYTATYEEVVQHEFRFRATSFDAVHDEFENAADNSELDFTDGYLVHSTIVKVVCDEDNIEEHWDMSFGDMENHIVFLERLAESFKCYVANDEQAAAETDYIYHALCSAGCSEEDIRWLGFGYCIPGEETEETASVQTASTGEPEDVDITYDISGKYTTRIYGECVDTTNVDEIIRAGACMIDGADKSEFEFAAFKPVKIVTADGRVVWRAKEVE